MAVTEAPTTPVAAASSAPTMMTPRASPPRKRPKRRPKVSRSSSASRDFSSIVPMKMKKGTASSVKFDIVPNVRSGMAMKRIGSKTPAIQPNTAKSIAAPARANATG